MSNSLRLVKIDSNYCDFLREYDYRVPYNKNSKELRPFIGILFTVDNKNYFAPLSSPKPKHLTMKKAIDFYKINDGKLGIVNCNNMIPVLNNNYVLLDLKEFGKTKEEIKYIKMLKKQLLYLNRNKMTLIKQARILYKSYINGSLNYGISQRCCNFRLLEEKCAQYNSVYN